MTKDIYNRIRKANPLDLAGLLEPLCPKYKHCERRKTLTDKTTSKDRVERFKAELELKEWCEGKLPSYGQLNYQHCPHYKF